jgi:hypothetical protein
MRRPRNLIKNGTYMFSVSTTFALACILTGCNDVSKQKRLASAAAQRFLALYNTDSCELLYDDASQYFQSRETCLDGYETVRNCERVSVPGAISPPHRVWVRGSAHFLNGEAEVRLE